MTAPTRAECERLREGAHVAHMEDLHRLAGLLAAVAALAEHCHDPYVCAPGPRTGELLVDLFTFGGKVATDLVTARDKRAEETT